MNNKIKALVELTAEQRFAVFVGWVKAQPRNQPYSFMDVKNCAMCQFVKSLHLPVDYIAAGDRYASIHEESKEYVPIIKLPILPVGQSERGKYLSLAGCRTFGELADVFDVFVKLDEPPFLKDCKPLQLTDAEMEVIETRALVPVKKPIKV